MAFVEYDHVVEELPTDGSNQAFDIFVLQGKASGGRAFPNAYRPETLFEYLAVGSVTVTDAHRYVMARPNGSTVGTCQHEEMTAGYVEWMVGVFSTVSRLLIVLSYLLTLWMMRAALSMPFKMENDLAGSRRPPVLEQEDALVSAQQQLAVADRNGKMGLRERAFDMGRHVVCTFGGMTVMAGVFRRLRAEIVLQIAQYIRIFVLLNKKRGGCVAQIERQQPYRSAPSVEPGHDVAGDLVQALTRRAHREAVLGDRPER